MGQRLRIDQASYEVTLVKVSGEPAEVRFETRAPHDIEKKQNAPLDPLGDAVVSRKPPKAAFPNVRRVLRHGVTLEDGTWVDLTEQLKEIDRAYALDGAEIESTVFESLIPNLKIRDAYYVVPAEEGSPKFLAYLWRGMNKARSASLVRFTKRTHQAFGALVAMRREGGAVLVLLELATEAEMRPVPPRAFLPVEAVSEEGTQKVTEALRTLRKPATVFEEMTDTRLEARADLNAAARAGVLSSDPIPVEETPQEINDLGEAILAAVEA